MKRTFNLSIYGDDTLKAKFELIKSSYIERNPGIPLSDSAAGSILIENEYQKILGKETNANRITTIVENQDEMKQELINLRLEVAQLTTAVLNLTGEGK